MRAAFLATLLTLLASLAFAKPAEEAVQLKTATGTIHGTLLVPESKQPLTVVLLIAGSGPTDRNGNNPLAGKNQSLALLADALASRGIATLRYDKRGIAESASAGASEKDLRFDMYVDDAAGWVAQLKKDPRFSSVAIAGHSEGSLIGIVAAQRGNVAAFASIAGVGRPADAVVRGQLAGKLPPELSKKSDELLVALKSGKTVDDVPQALQVLYRPSVQPYLISWFRYDPAAEIGKLKIPVLILQGTTDIQVGVADARALGAAKAGSQLEIIDGMNHVMKMVDADLNKQIASYGDPALPVAPKLVDLLARFVVSATAAR